MKIISGNLLEAKESVIAQQVNCQGVMGAGLALAIRKKWPEVYYNYKHDYDKYTEYAEYNETNKFMGNISYTKLETGQYVVNLYAQDKFGADNAPYRWNGRNTSYDAFAECLSELHQFMLNQSLSSVAFPYYIGCGLARGNWKIISELIEDEFGNDENIDVVCYKKD